MSKWIIEGGIPLAGTIQASGSKNSALPILAATILLKGESVISNVPNLIDVRVMLKMLNELGLRAEFDIKKNQVAVWNTKKIRHIAPYELVTSMRASFIVAGPVLARTGYAKIPLPGGCSIGSRPVDIHLTGIQALGAKIAIEHGFVEFKGSRLKGAHIYLPFPSVGATENIIMAASLSEGKSIIENAAMEPEINDLCHFLVKAGANISGIGTSRLTIEGAPSLRGISYTVIPDRVEVGTFMIAAAMTRGDITITSSIYEHVEALAEKLKACQVEVLSYDHTIQVRHKGRLAAVDLETQPFPGFPTDMQAQMMALMAISEGTSLIKETIFENRFLHVPELLRMGAHIKLDRHQAIVLGTPRLSGAEVRITDLRAGAALILAGLQAKGETCIYGLHHIRRGYENITQKLKQLGGHLVE